MTTYSDHPLYSLLRHYFQMYSTYRENNLDLSHLSFHRRFGFCVKVPDDWNVVEILRDFIAETELNNVLCIFNSTAKYQEVYKILNDKVKYISWQEIYTGMQVVNNDARYIQKAKGMLTEAGLIIFLNPPTMPEVVDQVRGHAAGCLIIVDQGDIFC